MRDGRLETVRKIDFSESEEMGGGGNDRELRELLSQYPSSSRVEISGWMSKPHGADGGRVKEVRRAAQESGVRRVGHAAAVMRCRIITFTRDSWSADDGRTGATQSR